MKKIEKEFSLKASSLGFLGLLGLMFISLNIALLIGSILITHNMLARVILMGAIWQVLVYGTIYFTKYSLKIVFENDNMEVYKNEKLVLSKKIEEIEKIYGADIRGQNSNMGKGSLRFYFTDNTKFKFGIRLSSKQSNVDQFAEVQHILRVFVNQYGFERQEVHTSLGKGHKAMRMYINSKYIKDE